MKKTLTILGILIVLLLIILAFSRTKEENPTVEITPTPTVATTTGATVVTLPSPNSKISSPLTINGTAPGNWYFEASFPIMLVDANGKQLGQTVARAITDWMTTADVPFTAVMTFTMPTTATGALILKNDNPSGDPARDKSYIVPVTFDLNLKATSTKTINTVTTTVKVEPTGQ